MRKITAILPLFLILTGCVYEYNAEVPAKDIDRLVVDGDIKIGEETTVNLSGVRPLGTSAASSSIDFTGASVWVEGEDGTSIDGVSASGVDGKFTVDTRDASPSVRYRLNISIPSRGRNYRTEWLEVQTDSSIDDLYFKVDEDGGSLNFFFDISSKNCKYFRWYFDEEWEYTSEYKATLLYERVKYVDENGREHTGVVYDMPEDMNTYYCWNRKLSTDINMMTTDNMSVNNLVAHKFNTIGFTDKRLSYIYRVSLYFFPVSQEGYDYWTQVKKNSNASGSLFSTVPSEMTGNVICVEDPDERVVGYVDASLQQKKVLYYWDIDNKYYINTTTNEDKALELTGIADESKWTSLYYSGYIPVYPDWGMSGYSGYFWGRGRCVDCTLLGGDKNRPDDWPTSDR